MKHNIPFVAVMGCLLLGVSNTIFAAQTNDVLSDIETLAAPGDKIDHVLVADSIKKDPAIVSSTLLPKLKDANATERQLAIYAWALGLTKDQATAGAIEELYRKSKSDLVKHNCLRALAKIGGKPAEAFLLSVLDAADNADKLFDILNLLGEMQCEAALPKADIILQRDPQEFYWQPIFVFGKMGDKAVPFLLKRINSKNRNVRVNTISILGQWLIPPEAAKPLQDQFWAEKDMELRHMILCSLEATIADLSQMKTVFEKVVAKEKDGKLVKYARETLGGLDETKAALAAFTQKKQDSAVSFKREYTEIFESGGKKGDYEILGNSSTIQDEPQLKALRERILQRDSDESFYDYQKVNKIIMRNRMIKAMGTEKGS
jgi:hypothetical protein